MRRLTFRCSHTDRLGHVKSDAAAIARTVQAVENQNGTILFISSLNEHFDDIRIVVEHKASDIRRVEEAMRRRSLGRNLKPDDDQFGQESCGMVFQSTN